MAKKKTNEEPKRKEQNVVDDPNNKAEGPIVKNDQAESEKEAAIKKESVQSKQLQDKKTIRTTSSSPVAKRRQNQTRNSNGTITVKTPKINLGPKGSGKTSGFSSLKDEIK